MTSRRLSPNRLRFLIGLMIVTLLVISGGAIFAQDATPETGSDAPWGVYLSNYTDIQLTQFNPDGSTSTYDLPQNSEQGLGSNNGAFSPDESRIAYCTAPPVSSEAGAAPVAPTYTLTVYDLMTQSSVVEAEIGEVQACTITSDAFSQDGSRIAVGVITQYPSGPETPQPESTWQLRVLDANTGENVATLDALDPALSALGIDSAQMLMMPFTRRVDGSLVVFALVNWFTEGLPSYNAFVWDTNAGTVEEAPLWGQIFSGDEILTADGLEFAYAMLDENQPAANPGGPTFEANTVVVQREGSEPQVVYTNTEEVITSVRYINDGTALAIGLLEGVAEGEMPADQAIRYIMLSRDGSTSEIAAPVANASIEIRPVPAGYINFTRVFNAEASTLSYTLDAVTNGQSTNLWTEEGDLNSSQWTLVHATPPDLSGVSLPEFTPAAA